MGVVVVDNSNVFAALMAKAPANADVLAMPRWEWYTVLRPDCVRLRRWEDKCPEEGIDVDQELLSEVYSWLSTEKRHKLFPSNYRPSIERLIAACEGPTSATLCPEGLIAGFFNCPDDLSWWRDEFVARFIEKPSYAVTLTPALDLLTVAGFPAVTATAVSRGLDRPIKEAVRAWVEGYEGPGTHWIWLKGRSGGGKTCSAAWAVTSIVHRAEALRASRPDVKFLHARTLADLADSSPRYGPDNLIERLVPYQTCDLLVLDDLGVETATAQHYDAFSRVCDARVEQMRPTVITTQYGGGEWLRLYQHVTDRHIRSRMGGRLAQALCGWPQSKPTPEELDALLRRAIVSFEDEDLRSGSVLGVA